MVSSIAGNKKQRRRRGVAGHRSARAPPWCPPSQATGSREGSGIWEWEAEGYGDAGNWRRPALGSR